MKNRTNLSSMADVEAFEQRRPLQEFCRGNTYDIILNSAKRYSNRAAIKLLSSSSGEREICLVTYQELLEKVTQSANLFHASLDGKESVVSCVLPSLPQTHYAIWGAEACGVAGPINQYLSAEAIRDIMIASATEVLVTLGPSGDFDIWEKICSVADQVPTLKVIYQVNLVGVDPEPSLLVPKGIPFHDFDQALSAQSSASLNFDRLINENDLAALFHTGGTTGMPKLAQHSHKNQVYMATIGAEILNFNQDTVALVGLPLFHVNAVFLTGLNVFSAGGCAVLLTPHGFRGKGVVPNLWHLIERFQATFVSVVPTIISALIEVPIGSVNISSLEFFACGAAPLAPNLQRRFEEVTGIPLCEGYGLTEGTAVCSANPVFGNRKAGSIGLRLPHQDLKTVHLNDKREYLRDCKGGEVGALIIKGPNVFSGYKEQAKNRSLFLDGGWLVTGDMARQDEEGYTFITGRMKDLIIRGGHNIDPQVIEDAMTLHPAVELAAAIGQPDAYAGELPCVYLTLKSGNTLSSTEIEQHARLNIHERAAIPVHFEVLDQMPITAVGKIYKPALRALSTERVLHKEMQRLGCEANIKAVQDERVGIRVLISTLSEHEPIQALMDKFSVSYELLTL